MHRLIGNLRKLNITEIAGILEKELADGKIKVACFRGV